MKVFLSFVILLGTQSAGWANVADDLVLEFNVVTREAREYSKTAKQWRDVKSRTREIIQRAERMNLDPVLIAQMYRKYGNTLLDHSPHQREAKAKLLQAKEIHEQNGTPDRLQYALTLIDLGRYRMAFSPKKAASLFSSGLEIIEQELGAESQNALIVHQFLVAAYERTGQSDKATEHIEYLAALEPENNVSEPTPIFRIQHQFPYEGLRNGIEAKITVGFTIDRTGRVKDPYIMDKEFRRTAGQIRRGQESKIRRDFEREALKAVRTFRYKPGVRDGKFVDLPDRVITFTWSISR